MALNKKIVLALLLMTLSTVSIKAAIAPKVKYWVKFTDKNGTPYSLSNPLAFLTQKSIDRRIKYNIPLHFSDLPVNPSYVAAVEGVAQVEVIYVSKWLNGVVVRLDSASVAPTAFAAMASFGFVQMAQRVNKFKLNAPKPEATYQAKTGSTEVVTGYNYGGSGGQNRQLKLTAYHDKGFRGQGITIGVLDAGFDNVDTSPVFDSLRNNGGILGTRDFCNGGNDAYHGSSHGTMVMSCLAGNKPGVAMGTAPLAKYWLFRTEEGPETISEEYNWIRGAEFADSVGCDILTTSLGYTTFDNGWMNHTYADLNGRTAPMSIAANMAARKGIFVLNAAGNEGASSWKYIGVAADADSICTVGAVDTSGVYAAFSSVGPTSDGRIKPDLVACGWNAYICDASSNCYQGNGTSFATPVLAGAVACFWQANPGLNNMQVLDALKKMGSNAATPNNTIGWGVPQLKSPITGISDVKADADFDFTVYADPNNSMISIKLSDFGNHSVFVEVYDPIGKLVYQSPNEVMSSSTTLTIDAGATSDGIYLVRVKTPKATRTKKFLKQ